MYLQCVIYKYKILLMSPVDIRSMASTVLYGTPREISDVRDMQIIVDIRLYEYWHEQVKIRKKRRNNTEIKKFYWK
jgi:hypothetical protein